MITETFYWVGLAVCMGSGIIAAAFVLHLLIGQSINLLAYAFPALRQVIEFVYYRKDYKEWKALKDAGKAPTEDEIERLKRVDKAYEEIRGMVWSTIDENGDPIEGTGTHTIGEQVCTHFGM